MKKVICMLLTALLLLAGCQADAPAETTAGETSTGVPELVGQTPPIQTLPGMVPGDAEGEIICFRNAGNSRIEYTGDRRYVRYITSADQLPDEEVLKDYDEAFFEESALLLVVETVGSGSVQLEIGSIHISEGVASVTLRRNMPGQAGTDDMATWLLWAEVDRDLDCQWILEGGKQQSQEETY